MIAVARLRPGETLGDRVLGVDHCGEHGAVCVYRAQRRVARWTAPALCAELDGFLAHEQRHRALFAEEIARRGRGPCWTYALCGFLGTALGSGTGMLGARAIAATTVAIEQVVLRHMTQQIATLAAVDPAAVSILRAIVDEEQAHHDLSLRHLRGGILEAVIRRAVGFGTEAVIWIGMR